MSAILSLFRSLMPALSDEALAALYEALSAELDSRHGAPQEDVAPF